MVLNNIRALWENIVAKLRDMMVDARTWWRHSAGPVDFDNHTKAKRERETVTSCHGMDAPQPVTADNGFAMREALEQIERMAQWGGSDLGNPVVRGLLDTLTSIREKAKLALVAPPRNCDKFADDESAWKAYVAEHGGESEFGEPGGLDPAEYPTWLFDTETQEGDE